MNITFWYEATGTGARRQSGAGFSTGHGAAMAEAFAGEPDVNFRAVTLRPRMRPARRCAGEHGRAALVGTREPR